MDKPPSYSRVERLVALVIAENPKASKLVDLVVLAEQIDPGMPMAEVRKAWSQFNNHHRTPRIGRMPNRSDS